MDIYKVDVTGADIFANNYGVVILYNNKYPYAYKFDPSLQKKIRKLASKGEYGVAYDRRIKPRLYCSIVFLLFKQISQEHQVHDSDFEIHFCNDFDGYQNVIIERLCHLTKTNFIFKDIHIDNYSFRRHSKSSKIQKYCLALSRNEYSGLSIINLDENDIHNLIAKKKLERKSW